MLPTPSQDEKEELLRQPLHSLARHADDDGEVYGIKDGQPREGKGMPDTAELGPTDGTDKVIKMEVPFGKVDFIVHSKFVAEQVNGTAMCLQFWCADAKYNVGLDGGKDPHVFFVEGGVWNKGEQGPTLMEAGKLHTLTARRRDGILSILWDGKPTRFVELPLDVEITAIAWRPWRNRIKVESLSYVLSGMKSFLQVNKTSEYEEAEYLPDRLLTEHMKKIKSMTFIQKWKGFRQNQKDLATLSFVLPRMEFHKTKVDMAPGILQHLAGISNLHAELIAFAESGSPIGRLLEDIFVEEVEVGLSAAGAMPTKEQVVDFLTACIDVGEKTKVPECGNMTLRQCAACYRSKPETHPDYQKIIPHLEVLKRKTFDVYALGVAKEHLKVSQMLSWAAIPLWASSEFKTTPSTLAGPGSWAIKNKLAFGGVRDQVRLKNKLSWTPIVDFYNQKFDMGHIDGFDVMPKSDQYELKIATTRFVRRRMPRMIFDLQSLRNELTQQVKEIEASRARVMAYGVTIGITVGNFLSGVLVDAYKDWKESNE
jgi:hypothetical protein